MEAADAISNTEWGIIGRTHLGIPFPNERLICIIMVHNPALALGLSLSPTREIKKRKKQKKNSVKKPSFVRNPRATPSIDKHAKKLRRDSNKFIAKWNWNVIAYREKFYCHRTQEPSNRWIPIAPTTNKSWFRSTLMESKCNFFFKTKNNEVFIRIDLLRVSFIDARKNEKKIELRYNATIFD